MRTAVWPQSLCLSYGHGLSILSIVFEMMTRKPVCVSLVWIQCCLNIYTGQSRRCTVHNACTDLANTALPAHVCSGCMQKTTTEILTQMFREPADWSIGLSEDNSFSPEAAGQGRNLNHWVLQSTVLNYAGQSVVVTYIKWQCGWTWTHLEFASRDAHFHVHHVEIIMHV